MSNDLPIHRVDLSKPDSDLDYALRVNGFNTYHVTYNHDYIPSQRMPKSRRFINKLRKLISRGG